MIDHAVATTPVDVVAYRTQNLIEPSKNYNGTNGTGFHSMTPHPVRRAVGCLDLTGRSFGTFVVVGLSAIPCKAKGRRWSCRCKCGAYELRTEKVITGETAKLQTCASCYDLLYVRDHSNRVVRIKYGIEDMNQMEKKR